MDQGSLNAEAEFGARPAGLSDEEAARRQAAGEANVAAFPTSRSYIDIVRENVFSFVNSVLFFLGAALVALGRPADALVSVGVVLANSLVGVTQEVRAKRTLDRIALLTRPTAKVVRGGRERVVDPSAVVRGDVLAVRPGDQIVADGQVLGGSILGIDESLLTGESRPVGKRDGDPVFSGSLCLTGQGYYEACDVGARSLANRLTAGARAFRREYTPLQREINLVIRIVLLIAGFLEFLIVVDAAISRVPVVETVAQSVVVIGLVPNGLVLAIAVAYGAGAVRIAGHGILVQQSNAIESLSHVDVLCLDKTGTLTTGFQEVRELHAFGISLEDLRGRLGEYAAAVSAPNRTIDAIARAIPAKKPPIVEEIPFSPDRRWSAVAFRDSDDGGTYYLGAPDALGSRLEPDAARDALIRAWTERGWRVLLFARQPNQVRVLESRASPALPNRLIPFGLIGLGEELRADAGEALGAFSRSGVRIKIISGDDPQTVVALVNQIGLHPAGLAMAGSDLAGLSPAAFQAAAAEATIFGRIAPDQKRDLILAYRSQGHHVAMIGDGVNDVLALKQANLGIAMGTGSPAARAVADLMLLEDSFGYLPLAIREGQRIQNGMNDILKLFLTRVFSMTLVLVGTGIVSEFPLGPKHNALLTLLTVGIPSIALAAWARPGSFASGSRFRAILHFVLPATFMLTLVELCVHVFAYVTVADSRTPVLGDAEVGATALAVAQTGLTTVGIMCGLLLFVFVEPPTEALAGGDTLSGDWRPTFLALALGVAYAAILLTSNLRGLFDLTALTAPDLLGIALVSALWGIALREMWRSRLMERFLELDWDWRSSDT